MANDDGQDLLAAALDDAGLSFLDTAEVTPEYKPVVYIQSNSTAPRGGNVRTTPLPTVSVSANNVKRIIRVPVSSLLQTNINGTKAPGQSLLANRQLIFHPNNSNLMASNIVVKKVLPSPVPAPEIPDESVIDDDDDEYKADTYSIYKPSKLKIGLPHPDPVVEATSLASVQPPDVTYRLAIPEEVIDEGKLSALQLESIVYASQQHETFLPDGSRAGFLLGDGAGVGKGRTLAGIIYENWELGRKKAIWLSVSNDLKFDAERDLRDIGASKIPVHLLNKFRYGKISKSENGGFKKGIIFSTYSSLIGETATASKEKYRTRLGQLIHWFGKDFDGVIVFDECHKAKNLCPSGSGKPTKTGRTVLELQRKLPQARIVYASATGASEPKNMAYMVRLGLWGKGTSFPEFSDFATAVEKRGVGAMEMVAIEMKLRGVYIARQLSFHGVEFKTEKIELSNKFVKLYNECVDLWVDAKLRFERALELMEDDNTVKKTVWGQFWGSHQRFFKYLCIAAKVKHAVNIAREALKSDKCVVIGLQSTGEAKTIEQLEESNGELTDFVSTAKAVFQTLIEKHFPAPNRKKTLKLLGRDSSLLDQLGISLNDDGSTKLSPLDDIFASTSSNKRNQNETKWNISDSEGEDSDAAGAMFDISASDSDDDDFDTVSEKSDSDMDEMDKLWDAFQSKQNAKAKKRKINKKKKPAKKRPVKRRRVVAPKQDYGHLRAEFLSEEACQISEDLRDQLLERLENMSNKLPPNTLDELIDELGGTDQVAEMTGRKGRVVSNESGNVQYESRTENDVSMDILNVAEKQRFMDGEKMVAIISEAASSGISLHSDRRAINRKRRVHITIELPWSADRAIQQFGRSHRSNQVRPPEYIFLISDLAGEKRFASIVASRLQSLGALSHGDRNAKRDLSEYHIDSRHGQAALELIMKTIASRGKEPALVKAPKINNSEEEFFSACCIALHGVGLLAYNQMRDEYTLEKDSNSLPKFLNRLLGMPFELQNALFKFFNDNLTKLIKKAKENGYTEGIRDVSSDVSKVEIFNEKSYIHRHTTGSCVLRLYHVGIDKGVPWETVEVKSKSFKLPEEGFYMNPNLKGTLIPNVFMASCNSVGTQFTKQQFLITKPNGVMDKKETGSNLKSKYKKLTVEEAKKHWTDLYNATENQCAHRALFNRCRKEGCEMGARKLQKWILTGAVLSMWDTFEKRYPQHFHKSKIRIYRLKISDKINVIGIHVEKKMVNDLQTFLENPNPLTEVKPPVIAPPAATVKSEMSIIKAEPTQIKIEQPSIKVEGPEQLQPVKSMPIFKL